MTNNPKMKKMIVIPLLFFALLIQGTQVYAGGRGVSRGGRGYSRGGHFHGGGGGFHRGRGGYRQAYGSYYAIQGAACAPYAIYGATCMSTPIGYYPVVLPPPVIQAPQPIIVQAAPQPNITIIQNAAPAQQAPQDAAAAPRVPRNAVIENTTQWASPDNGQDFYVVNIPKSKGTYTPVALKKAGAGFIGPQGEYYARFPLVEQLVAMYAQQF